MRKLLSKARYLGASLVLLAGLSLPSVSVAVGKKHPFGWEDMFAMIRLSDLQASRDGKWLVYTRTAFDVEKNGSNSDIEMIEVGSGRTVRLTTSEAADFNGRFSPDGSFVYFLSTRSGKSALWRISTSGGEAEKVYEAPVDIEGFEPSPDGKKIVFWAQVFPDCPTLKCTAERLEEREKSKVKAMIFDRLFIRHWDRWFDGRRNHLFVLDLQKLEPRDLMKGMDQDCPTIPWGGGDEIAWSPDSRNVVFASKPSKGEAWHTNVELYMADVQRPRKPRLITKSNPAWDTGPVFSPDGGTLAYLAMKRPGYESDRFYIKLYDMKTKKITTVAEGWDRSPQQIAWSNDGNLIYAVAQEHARRKVFQIDVKSGKAKALVSEGASSSMVVLRDGRLAFLNERMTRPREVFLFDPATGKSTQLSHVNDTRLAATIMSEPEDFWFENDGRRLHGWLLRPVGFRKGRKYPLAFLIHGGPQGSWLDNFHYRWNPQFYAGAGYAVVAIDFRGSTGYGQEFCDAIRGNWGPGPYSDLMAGLEQVLKTHDFIDRKRMCALGASFGGYMINWIAGQDHPFACLVNHDGDFDTTSSYYNTDELWFPEWEMMGPPWKSGEIYRKNSPARFVGRWKTPMLVIQGARDFRVVETEAFSTFNALQRRGIPSKLLYFPDENHWVLKPQNSRLWHRTVLEWIDRWTHTRRPRRR